MDEDFGVCPECGGALAEITSKVIEHGTALLKACRNCGRRFVMGGLPLAIFLANLAPLEGSPSHVGAERPEELGSGPESLGKFQIVMMVTATATGGSTGNPVLDQIFREGGDPDSITAIPPE